MPRRACSLRWQWRCRRRRSARCRSSRAKPMRPAWTSWAFYRALRIFVTRPTAWRSHRSPFVIPSRNPQVLFRAAGEESPLRATPRSLASARDDRPASFPRPDFATPNGNTPMVIPSRNPRLSFRAAGEESAPLATPGSLALLGMTSQRHPPGLVRHSERQRPHCHSEPQARNLRRSQCRDPSRSLGMTMGSHSKPKARNLRRSQRRDPSRCSG